MISGFLGTWHRWPYLPEVPCHRVIRTDGSLGGYSGPGGVETKRKLLREEGVTFPRQDP